MKRKTVLSVSLIVISLAVIIAGGGLTRPKPALSDDPVGVGVSLSAPDEVAADSDFSVTVTISQVESFDACNYDLIFDSSLLRLDDITPGNIGSTPIPIVGTNEIAPGTLRIVHNIPGLSGISGSGSLTVLHFHCIGPLNETTTINLSNGALSNVTAQAITATWTGALINAPPPEPGGVSSPPPVTDPTDTTGITDASGVFVRDVTTESTDGQARLTISKDTVGLSGEAEPVSEISVAVVSAPPAPPDEHSIVGSVYDLGPSGATFSRPITLSLSYTPSDVPDDASENDLFIAYWSANTAAFVVLDGSTVDIENNTVTAGINHFTPFAILAYIPGDYTAPPTPAAFSVSDLLIFPSEVAIGEKVTVSAVITNSGTSGGQYESTLNIDEKVEATRTVEVAAGASKQITFTVSRAVAGSYTVNIDRLSDTFAVKANPPLIPPSAPAEPAPAEPSTAINWPVLGSVIGAVAIALGLFISSQIRRRSY
ncbi:cohesin domain-containing protein [Chloroflexota bacterium]